MTVLAVSPSVALSGFGPREATAWGAAAVVVLAAHVMLFQAAQYLREPDPAGSDTPPAMVVELAPMAVAPAIEEHASPAEQVPPETAVPVEHLETLAASEPDRAVEIAPEPVEQAVAERAEPVDQTSPVESNMPDTIEPERTAAAEPVEAESVEAEPAQAEPVETRPVETARPVEAEHLEPEAAEPELVEARQEPLEQIVPDIVEAVQPEVLVPLPEARPVDKPAVAKKAIEKAAPQKAAPQKAAPRKQKAGQPPKATASARADAKPAPRGAEGVSKPRVSPAKWQAKVQSWLNRHKRYPSAAKSRRVEGNVQLSFTIDASGRVTSSRIARSSGNAELDRAALEMVQRASPVPPPPPEIARSSMRIAVPVAFNLK